MKAILKNKVFKISIIVVAVFTSIFHFYGVFKVTDPASPRFNPQNFSFFDYGASLWKLWEGDISIIDAFKRLFPVGTPKKHVDEILVGAGGSTVMQALPNLNIHAYTEPCCRTITTLPKYFFMFDDEDRLVNIRVGYDLYPDQLSIGYLFSITPNLREKNDR